MINQSQIIQSAIPLILVLFGISIFTGIIENLTKKKRKKEDNIKVIIGTIIAIPLITIIFPKLALFFLFIIILFTIIEKIIKNKIK